MKLFMVLTIFGKLSATIGPLPYGEAECWERLPFLATFEKAWAAGTKLEIDGRPITRADVVAECVFSATRPTAPGQWHTLGKEQSP